MVPQQGLDALSLASEQRFLTSEFGVDLGGEAANTTHGFGLSLGGWSSCDLPTLSQTHQLVGQLQRGHDCDPIGAHHATRVAQSAHALIDRTGCFDQLFLALGGYGEAVVAIQDAD